MRAATLGLVASAFLAASALAQRSDLEGEARDAMSKLAFLAGEWEGEATMDMGPGARHKVAQVETVESKLDGLLLVVEGVGHKVEDGKLVHHALGVISYDARAKHYRVAAYRQDGEMVNATGTFLPDGAFQWSFEITGQRRVRYTIRQSTDGEWLETGEMSPDGTKWLPFLDMKLRRKPVQE
jgi:hypothetical protein